MDVALCHLHAMLSTPLLIPPLQVLTPDPKAALKIVSEAMSEEFLHSLSNYCSLQVSFHLTCSELPRTLHIGSS